jgi:hypothetical protein
MGMNHLVSSAQQRSYTSVVGGQEVPCQAQFDGFGVFAIFPGLVTVQLSYFSDENCSER